MSELTFTSPRTRGLGYLLVTIASTTVFGHLSEFCVQSEGDCTAHQHTVISFGVLTAAFGLLLLLGALIAIPKLRFMELSLSCLCTSCSLVMAIIASLEKTREDMLVDTMSIPDIGELVSRGDSSGPVFWDIVVGFSWFSLFLTTSTLYHLVLFGLKAEQTKQVEDTA